VGGVAIDDQLCARPWSCSIARDIGDDVFAAQLVDHLARIGGEFIPGSDLQRILNSVRLDAVFDREVLKELQESWNVSNFATRGTMRE